LWAKLTRQHNDFCPSIRQTPAVNSLWRTGS
jgi:hypothetical protein